VSEKTFEKLQEAVKKHYEDLGTQQPHIMFSSLANLDETAKERLGMIAHRIVVRDTDIKEAYANLYYALKTHEDHEMVLSFGSQWFVKDGVLNLTPRDLPQSLRHLRLVDPKGAITKIKSYFLNGHDNLVSLNINGLYRITEIDKFFLNNCHNLETLDLASIGGLEKVGLSFAAHCSRLTDVRMSRLKRLTAAVGGSFLSRAPLNASSYKGTFGALKERGLI
jgi:hypothetical protein